MAATTGTAAIIAACVRVMPEVDQLAQRQGAGEQVALDRLTDDQGARDCAGGREDEKAGGRVVCRLVGGVDIDVGGGRPGAVASVA